MDPKEIRQLIELISKSNFSEFEMEREGFKLKLVKSGAVQPVQPAQQEVGVSSPGSQPNRAADAAIVEQPELAVDDGLKTVNSPIVGTFYRSSGPEVPSFVEAGTRVKKGEVICIVEAMKVMNEIESEFDAEIVEIIVSNAQPVEFGDPLFRVRPL